MNKMTYVFWALMLVALTGSPALYAEEEFKEVFEQTGEDDADPSAFEGDSDSMPGERAPENLPMDDAPVDAGVGIE